MQIKHRMVNGMLYISICGELDEGTARFTVSRLDEIISNITAKQIVFDLSELSFMDSTGIGVLLGRYKKLKALGIGVFIANPSSHAERIFRLTGLYEIMPKIS